MKMKTIVILLASIILAAAAQAVPPQAALSKSTSPPSVLTIDNQQYINANNILMFVTNHGNFGRDLGGVFGYDYGTFYPYNTIDDILEGRLINSIVYASGLWIGAIDSATGEIRMAVAEYDDEYVPGPMKDSTFQPDVAAFRIYKLYSDSLADNPNQDYMDWPIDQGAPWKIDTISGDTIPDMIGDQMLWAVYNDADTSQHNNDAGNTLELGLEVRQTTFAFDRTDPLGNVIFIRLQVFNRGYNTLRDCYLSLWADPDLGEFTDDLVGCDTNLSVGFCYNGTNNDNQFGSTPPCVGYDFFQGPLVYTGNPADEARMWGTTFPGYKNMVMTSFNKYINGTDPDNAQETYNYMRGLNRDGSVYTYNGIPTKFFVSGDPVSGAGDLDFASADRRFMMTTGPVTFRPGDSTEILAAIVVGQGVDRITSVAAMKYFDKFAQDAYENAFVVVDAPTPPQVTVAVNDGRIALTWTDQSEINHGTFPFEGYTVWQGAGPTGPWRQIANFDIANTIGDIFDDVFDVGTGVIEIRRVKHGTNLGVAHDIVLKEDVINGGPIHNLTTYWYKVDAYSFNPKATVFKTWTSEFIVSATPQPAVAGISYEYNSADTLKVRHIGTSDGVVTPFVVDPKLFDSTTYEITFTDTVGFRIDTIYNPAYPGDLDSATFISYDMVWHLVNMVTGDTVRGWQWDQSGDSTYENIAGMLLKVSGPPFEGKDFAYASAVPANWSPVTVAEWRDDNGDPYKGGRWFTGASESGGELLFGGVYLAPNFDFTTLGPADYKTVNIVFRPMISYTDLTGDSLFDIGEPYVAQAGSNDQKAFMYQGWSGDTYEGFFDIPFTAWDVNDPDNPRQLNVIVRDRDSNHQWDLDNLATDADTLTLPNGGDLRYNYVWILNTTYDPGGTMYDDGSAGIDFMANGSDAMWVLWLGDRGNGGMLAEEDTLTLIPYIINNPSDTFQFTLTKPDTILYGEEQLNRINVVPNPFYLYGPYDPAAGNYQLKFQHLPEKCTIRIFNLGGDLVRVIEKDDPNLSWANWDVKTENGLLVASGIYLYVIDAPGFGVKVGKMAIFTEVEVLGTY